MFMKCNYGYQINESVSTICVYRITSACTNTFPVHTCERIKLCLKKLIGKNFVERPDKFC